MKGIKSMFGKGLVLLLAIFMVLTGCSSDSETESAGLKKPDYKVDKETPAWKLDKRDETTTLTWYVNADWWNADFGNDFVTKQIKKDLNIDVKFITGDDTKLNALFSGGDIPDIISLFDANAPIAKKANTWALPLNELADTYDPYFHKVAVKDTLKWHELKDGKTYGYANFSNTQADYDQGVIPATTAFVIRKDVYEAIGKPEMKTPEQFQSAMTKIKEQFPKLIPFGPSEAFGEVLQDYIGVPLETKDGKFYNRNLDKDYLTWLETFNGVYQKGGISDDSFADDNTAMEEKIKAGKYASMLISGIPQKGGALQSFKTNNPGSEYIAVDGPESTVGNAPTLNQSGITGWMMNYITKKSKDPAKATQLFTYLLSEKGQTLVTYGIEGETYTVNADGKYEYKPEIKEMRTKNPDQYKKEYRFGEFFFFGHDKYNLLSDDSTIEATKQMAEWGKGKLVPHFVLEGTNPDQGTPEARSFSAIDTEWQKTVVSMVRAKSDNQFDKELKNYEKFLDENNWDKITDIKTKKMEQNREKLGMK
ncbi:sugar ABC transporter substrate-binding protein [Fictibacillus sp. 26RED30]|uniref:sugar ABC transporter substrate-binding protein n=1 Tax=Fictibacillus sp. 26RED30 TaxID=2745877 RepID=UPI0018CEE5AB|nr:sugar ABC transporter substrate-binding protein [Fictibacillus sp. 26RED30]MBH0161852.1 sugar ABC transporter substrate-binding protein [Fictibacillus sp. 26RED30]